MRGAHTSAAVFRVLFPPRFQREVMEMRSYEDMVRSGDWPPTNREAIRFYVGLVIGVIIGWAARGVV